MFFWPKIYLCGNYTVATWQMDQVCQTLPVEFHQKLYLQDETPIFGVQCPWLLIDYWWTLDTALGYMAIQIWEWMVGSDVGWGSSFFKANKDWNVTTHLYN